jgi:hypothetical protein
MAVNRHAVRARFSARSQLTGVRAPNHVAAETFDHALEDFLRAVGDPLAHIEPMLVEHPEFVMGQMLRASAAVAAKHPSALPMLRGALESIPATGVEPTEQERAHLAAARAWLHGQPELAARCYTAILREWPRDLLALRLAQSCHFFLGHRLALREVTELVWPSWTAGMPGYEYLLAMTAFGCAENGDDGRAEALGRQALAMQPVFPFAIHAVAHALYGRASFAQGAWFMQQHRPHWARNSRMVAHNAWHAAMFELESGDPARALEVLDESLMPHATRSASDAADATALLWRLEVDGVDPGRRWSLLSDCWAIHASPGYWPFVDLHAAIAFSAAGHTPRAHSLARAISACARRQTGRARAARIVTLSGLRAIEAFAAGAYAEVRDIFRGLRPALERIGGSHAQHELFGRMFTEAGRRLRTPDLVEGPVWGVAA